MCVNIKIKFLVVLSSGEMAKWEMRRRRKKKDKEEEEDKDNEKNLERQNRWIDLCKWLLIQRKNKFKKRNYDEIYSDYYAVFNYRYFLYSNIVSKR